MDVQVLARQEPATALMVVLEPGERVLASLVTAAREHQITAASITALGAFSHTTLAFFDRATLRYDEFHIDDQVELLSLVGNLSLLDGEPRLHTHAVLGYPDGSVRGGHLVDAEVWPTLEVSVTAWPAVLERTVHPEITLPLLTVG